MSQPRRRRRRRRRGGQGTESQPKQEGIRQPRDATPAGEQQGPKSGRSRRRRGKGRSGGRQPASPKSSEDLVRALPRERPEQLTAPPDGQTLEQVIGELQSTWGVPAYPQEYRITVKVAEERSDAGNGDGGARERASATRGVDQPKRERANAEKTDQPRREKAPAAPGIGSSAGGREKAPRKRRRRRRRGGGESGGVQQAGPPPKDP